MKSPQDGRPFSSKARNVSPQPRLFRRNLYSVLNAGRFVANVCFLSVFFAVFGLVMQKMFHLVVLPQGHQLIFQSLSLRTGFSRSLSGHPILARQVHSSHRSPMGRFWIFAVSIFPSGISLTGLLHRGVRPGYLFAK